MNREITSKIEKDIYIDHVRYIILQHLVNYTICEEYCEMEENEMIDSMIKLTIAEDECDQLVSYLCLLQQNKDINIWQIAQTFYTKSYRKYQCLLHDNELHDKEKDIVKAISNLGCYINYISAWHES